MIPREPAIDADRHPVTVLDRGVIFFLHPAPQRRSFAVFLSANQRPWADPFDPPRRRIGRRPSLSLAG
jgi:hypothetical protein